MAKRRFIQECINLINLTCPSCSLPQEVGKEVPRDMVCFNCRAHFYIQRVLIGAKFRLYSTYREVIETEDNTISEDV